MSVTISLTFPAYVLLSTTNSVSVPVHIPSSSATVEITFPPLSQGGYATYGVASPSDMGITKEFNFIRIR